MGVRLNYPATQEGLVIPVSVWNGLIGRIKGLKHEFRPWSVAYSVFFGMGATAGLSIAPLMISDAPSWAVPTYGGACVSAIVIGVGFLFVDRSLTRQQSSNIGQLAGELEKIRDESIEGFSSRE